MGYDKVSDQPIIWVREMDESESGQMVLEKVKWTFFDAYLWQTMWNHAKKLIEGSNLSDFKSNSVLTMRGHWLTGALC